MTKPANGNAVGWHRMAGGHVRRPDLVLPSPYGFKRTNPATALLDKRFDRLGARDCRRSSGKPPFSSTR